MKRLNVLFVHLFNDFSGSPLVLKNVVTGLKGEVSASLITSNSEGFLSNLEVDYYPFKYTFKRNKWLRLLEFLIAQWKIFFVMINMKTKMDVCYVNTILPFGAALAAKLKGIKVIYHVHETSVKPEVLKKLLLFMVQFTADEIIYVSHFLAKREAISEVKSRVVYNALSKEFLARIEKGKARNRKQILMLSSLKHYKGIDQFVALAKRLPQFNFDLVVNASYTEMGDYFSDQNFPENLYLYDAQEEVHPFYANADLVLNLSIPDLWQETFGMTALEAMAHGIPVIVPPVGGIAEIIDNGIQGLQIDARNLGALMHGVCSILEDPKEYDLMSKAAYFKSKLFSIEEQIRQVRQILDIHPRQQREILAA
ncbi:MAG: glycosyltransferase family 4 protein [Flavobacteriales bacterium]|nr:glycosyltransferase family 4 protein [Flavobacteriales bacterium]